MTKSEIPKLAKQCLADSLGEPGSILYSSHETLKAGPVYLLGLNPGGTGGAPIIQNIEGMLNNRDCAYLDECWKNKISCWPKGEAPLQVRISWILDAIGLNIREVCASNLIFFQSREAKDINYSLAPKCWPIHQAILEIVRPRLILAFGNSAISPYRYLYEIFCGSEERFPSGHGNWSVKGFDTSMNGQKVYIVGLPHLSRYSIIGKDRIVRWLRSKL